MNKLILIGLALCGVVHTSYADTLIPRSVFGDKGQYYLLASMRNGNIVTAIHKRVGPNDTYYTKTETNCTKMKMREIGGSDVSVKSIKPNSTKWFDLVPGSNKSDLANFVCTKR